MKTEPAARTLYQIPISHYCEKSRWHLDAKGLAYRIENVVPGWNRFLGKRLGVRGTVPILVDQGTAIGDSGEITHYLERTYPQPSLLPAAEHRGRASSISAYFDDRVGPDLRRYAYGSLLGMRRGAAAEAMTAPYGLTIRAVGKVMAPLIERQLRSMYRITPASIAASHDTVLEGVDRLERELEGDPGRYLVGGAFSTVDIGVAALLAPLVGPPGTPWEDMVGMPDSVKELQSSVRARPAGAWLLRIYREKRGSAR